MNDEYTTINARAQVDDLSSVYIYWSNVLKLRKDYQDVFIDGSFNMLVLGDSKVFLYERAGKARKAVVILNFSDDDGVIVNLDAEGVWDNCIREARVLLRNYPPPASAARVNAGDSTELRDLDEASFFPPPQSLTLRPFEALVLMASYQS